MGGVHEDADGADGGDEEEEPQLGSVDHHGHVLPVLSDLQQSRVNFAISKNLIFSNSTSTYICALIEQGCGRQKMKEKGMQGQGASGEGGTQRLHRTRSFNII